MGSGVFSGVRSKWLPLYEEIKNLTRDALGEFEEKENSAAILWRHNSTFAEISAKSGGLVIAFASGDLHEEWGPAKALQTSKNRTVHYFETADNVRFPWFVERIKEAYVLTGPEKTRAKAAEQPAYSTIDEYIALFPKEVRSILEEIRRTIKENAPEAVEKIAWQMPTFWQGENLIHFSAFKKHIGIYPGDLSLTPFKERLAGYQTTKGTLRFPLDKPIDYALIAEITRYRATTAARKQTHSGRKA